MRRMKKLDINIDSLRERLSYDPETGVFTWLVTRGRAREGNRAGVIGSQGYRIVGIFNEEIPAARLAWAFCYGEWPHREVERINEDKLDDRIANLRLNVHSRDFPPLTQDRLKELLDYDPDTGVFVSLKKRGGSKPSTVPVGWTKPGPVPYILINVDGRAYRAHRLAWLYVYGEWPELHVDHANGNSLDNRIANLREAEAWQNLANAKKPVTNTSGYKGVQWHKAAQRWMATIRVRGETVYLGLFDDPAEAHAAYCSKAAETKGEFARTE